MARPLVPIPASNPRRGLLWSQVARNTAFPRNLMLSQTAALAKICGFNYLMFFKINRQLQNARSKIRY